jgi:hypothetical protein
MAWGRAWSSLRRPVDTPAAAEAILASVDSLDTVERIGPLRGAPAESIAEALPGQAR